MIDEIKEETYNDLSREEFLAICVKERLENLESSYEKEFDKFINAVETHIDYRDYSRLSTFLVGLSRSVNNSYEYLIKTLKILQSKD